MRMSSWPSWVEQSSIQIIHVLWLDIRHSLLNIFGSTKAPDQDAIIQYLMLEFHPRPILGWITMSDITWSTWIYGEPLADYPHNRGCRSNTCYPSYLFTHQTTCQCQLGTNGTLFHGHTQPDVHKRWHYLTWGHIVLGLWWSSFHNPCQNLSQEWSRFLMTRSCDVGIQHINSPHVNIILKCYQHGKKAQLLGILNMHKWVLPELLLCVPQLQAGIM